MSNMFSESSSVLEGNYSGPFGLGFEAELVQRATKAQIIRFLPEITETLQEVWNRRDKEFVESVGGSYSPLKIPEIEEKNIRSGIEVMSLIEAPLEVWPSVLIYSKDTSPYQFQEDQFDTISIPLCIEILCNEGPVSEENTHGPEGLKLMSLLDSKIHRLSDAILLCIKKDPSLSGTVGEIEKPSKTKTSLPWSRKESKTATGENYIFQGKQLEFIVQKLTV